MKTRALGLFGAALLAIALVGCSSSDSGDSTSLDYQSETIGTLKHIPAGQFQRDANSSNISKISAPFRISQHEITRAQFISIMNADPIIMKSKQAQSSGTSDPVFMVSWYEAIAFCNKLSVKEGLTPVYGVKEGGVDIDWSTITFSGIPINPNSNWDNATVNWSSDGYRLPTEMEWMWAAMGAPTAGQGSGTDTAGYLKAYAGSAEGDGTNQLGAYAWYSENAYGKTHPVGSKGANELGLYDMTGNVCELCWDWWSDGYPSGLLTDYRGAAPGDYRVAKGGSRGEDAEEFSVVSSTNPDPEWRDVYTGFRVARR